MPSSAPVGASTLVAYRGREPHPCGATTVYFHNKCPDGTTGAYTFFASFPEDVRAALGAAHGAVCSADSAGSPDLAALLAQGLPMFIGIAPGDQAVLDPRGYAGRHVYFVDVAHSAAVLLAVRAAALSLLVVDHHRSNQRTLAGLAGQVDSVFDECESGATLAHMTVAPFTPMPRLYMYVKDRDLWQYALPDSRAVSEGLFVGRHLRSFPAIEAALAAWPELEPQLTARGQACLDYKAVIVASHVAHAQLATVAVAGPGLRAEYTVRVVAATMCGSEIGEALMLTAAAADGVDFAATTQYVHRSGETWVSLRTTRDDVDLSAIAPHVRGAIRGGGHPRAAGFTIAGGTPLADVFAVKAAAPAPLQ